MPESDSIKTHAAKLQVTKLFPRAHVPDLVMYRSEIDDINLGLEHFYGDFNVVHAQLISAGVSD